MVVGVDWVAEDHGHLTHRVIAIHPWHDETFDVISQRLFMARLERDSLRDPLPVRLQHLS